MKMSIVSLACGVISSSIGLSVNIDYGTGTSTNFSGSINPPDTVTVEGELNVVGGTFAPVSLTINGTGSPNGDVNFNGGSISPGSIAVQGFSHLNVNATSSTSSLTNSNIVNVASQLSVQNSGSGVFTNSSSLFISSLGSITADSYVGDGGGSGVGGTGELSADTLTPAGALIPGDDENGPATGTLTLTSPANIPLADVTYLVDFFDNGGSFISDKILVNGSISLGGNSTLIVNPVSDLDGDLVDGQQFVIIDSTAALTSGDVFANIDEANYTVDDGSEIIGNFTVGYNEAAGQVYLTYNALVPEPGTMAGLGLAGISLLRRRR